MASEGKGIGVQDLKGVRDQIESFRRLQGMGGGGGGPDTKKEDWFPPEPTEMDMDDMFWEIPKNEVILSLDWALKSLRGEGEPNGFAYTREA